MGAPDGRENDLAGNTADARTVEAIVTMMEKKYGRGKRIRVMDRGMVSEGNLEDNVRNLAHFLDQVF